MLSRLPARWRRVASVALVLLAASLTAAGGGIAPFAAGAAAAAAPLQAGVTSAFSWIGSLFGGGGLRQENEALRRELDRLRREVQESRERLAGAERLERLLEYRDRTGFTMAAASVIGHDASGLYRTILLDRGGADGVSPGQAVLAPDGVVGKVIRAYPRSALVLLLTDRSSGIDAIVQRTRDRGIVQGQGAACELRYLDRSSEVEVGDYVVTSGEGGGFPKGVWLGRVSGVDRGGEMFLSVAVTPTADLAHLEEVLVVTGPER